MSEDRVEELDTHRFDELRVNYDHSFFGEELKEGKVALHARQEMDGRKYWAEVIMPKGLLDTSHELNFYKDQLERQFEQIKRQLNGQTGDTESD